MEKQKGNNSSAGNFLYQTPPVSSSLLTLANGSESPKKFTDVPTCSNIRSSVECSPFPEVTIQIPLMDETDDDSLKRFCIELEFVQALSNPAYIQYIAQRGYLEEEEFVNYLKYLQYWNESEYCCFLKYPQCLHILTCLQSPSFRQHVKEPKVIRWIEDQILSNWMFHWKKRDKIISNAEEREVKAESLCGLDEKNVKVEVKVGVSTAGET